MEENVAESIKQSYKVYNNQCAENFFLQPFFYFFLRTEVQVKGETFKFAHQVEYLVQIK